MNRRIAVRGIIVVDGKMLSIRHRDYNSDGPKDFWCTFGGGVEECEPLLSALERELVEETGIKPDIGQLLYVQQFKGKYAGKDEDHIEFFFFIKNPRDYLKIDLSKTSHGEKEIAEYAFIDPSAHNVLPEFLCHENYNNLDKQQTKFFDYL